MHLDMISKIHQFANLFYKLAVPIDLTYVRNLHDTEFREAAKKKKVTVYHGTSSKKLALIIRHGALDPAQSKDYTNWEDVSPGIYVTRQLEGFTGAWLYANRAASQDGGNPVVLELTVPLNWIDIDPDDTRHDEAGKINDLGENQGIIHKVINIKNIKGIQLQGKEISKIKPQPSSGIFETDKTEWMPIGVALRLIAKNVGTLPEEYQQMAAPIPKGMARQMASEELENKYAEAMDIFYSTYIGSPTDRFGGKTVNEVALIWFMKNKNVLWNQAVPALKEFGKIISVDMSEHLEYLADYLAPKPYETLARYLQRIRNA